MTEHLSVGDIAGQLDGVLTGADRARIEQHLVECDECRTELIALSRVLRGRPSRRRWVLPVGLAAAAVVLLLVRPSLEPPNYREPAISTTPAPVGLSPRGLTAAPVRLVWTRVPDAVRYRLTVFDSIGSVMWESQTTDTSVVLPGTVTLRPQVRYFWQVEAQTSWNRWIKSDMVEFARR